MSDTIDVLWIKAKGLPRRCRAGFCFDEAGYGIALASLSEEQLDALRADPYLDIEDGEAGDDAIGLLQHTGEIVGLDALPDYPGKLDTPPSASGPAGAPAVDGAPADADGDDHVDQQLDERAHTLRVYLIERQADGKGKPKVAEAKAATGIDDLAGAEIAAAWEALS